MSTSFDIDPRILASQSAVLNHQYGELARIEAENAAVAAENAQRLAANKTMLAAETGPSGLPAGFFHVSRHRQVSDSLEALYNMDTATLTIAPKPDPERPADYLAVRLAIDPGNVVTPLLVGTYEVLDDSIFHTLITTPPAATPGLKNVDASTLPTETLIRLPALDQTMTLQGSLGSMVMLDGPPSGLPLEDEALAGLSRIATLALSGNGEIHLGKEAAEAGLAAAMQTAAASSTTVVVSPEYAVPRLLYYPHQPGVHTLLAENAPQTMRSTVWIDTPLAAGSAFLLQDNPAALTNLLTFSPSSASAELDMSAVRFSGYHWLTLAGDLNSTRPLGLRTGPDTLPADRGKYYVNFTANMSASMWMDASASSASHVVLFDAQTTAPVSFAGGSGEDTIFLSHGNSQRTLSGGDGKDSYSVQTGTPADASAAFHISAAVNNITDFAPGGIMAGDMLFTTSKTPPVLLADGSLSIDIQGVATLNGPETLDAAVQLLEANMTPDRSVLFSFQEQTWLFAANAHKGVDSGDVLVRLHNATPESLLQDTSVFFSPQTTNAVALEYNEQSRTLTVRDTGAAQPAGQVVLVINLSNILLPGGGEHTFLTAWLEVVDDTGYMERYQLATVPDDMLTPLSTLTTINAQGSQMDIRLLYSGESAGDRLYLGSRGADQIQLTGGEGHWTLVGGEGRNEYILLPTSAEVQTSPDFEISKAVKHIADFMPQKDDIMTFVAAPIHTARADILDTGDVRFAATPASLEQAAAWTEAAITASFAPPYGSLLQTARFSFADQTYLFSANDLPSVDAGDILVCTTGIPPTELV